MQGRTRIWVADGAVHWQQGREHTVVPGSWVRRVEHDGGRLTLELFDDRSLTAGHKLPEVARALAAEIEPLIGDAPGPGERPPISDVTPPPVPVRAAKAAVRAAKAAVKWMSEWWYFAEPFQRFLLCYGILGLPVALLVAPVWAALPAWPMFAAGLGVVRWSLKIFNPRTYWSVWRRGVTVRAYFTPDYRSDAIVGAYWADYQTIEGHARSRVQVRWHNRRGEVRYDLRDTYRALAPTRVMWLVDLLGALFVGGLIGVGLMTPYPLVLALGLAQLVS